VRLWLVMMELTCGSILSRVAYATSLFDQDGIQVRFLNNRIEGNGINSEQSALQLVGQVKFSGESAVRLRTQH
jgi:hypothetical protein